MSTMTPLSEHPNMEPHITSTRREHLRPSKMSSAKKSTSKTASASPPTSVASPPADRRAALEHECFLHRSELPRINSIFKVIGAEEGDILRMILDTGCALQVASPDNDGTSRDPIQPKYIISRVVEGVKYALTRKATMMPCGYMTIKVSVKTQGLCAALMDRMNNNDHTVDSVRTVLRVSHDKWPYTRESYERLVTFVEDTTRGVGATVTDQRAGSATHHGNTTKDHSFTTQLSPETPPVRVQVNYGDDASAITVSVQETKTGTRPSSRHWVVTALRRAFDGTTDTTLPPEPSTPPKPMYSHGACTHLDSLDPQKAFHYLMGAGAVGSPSPEWEKFQRTAVEFVMKVFGAQSEG